MEKDKLGTPLLHAITYIELCEEEMRRLLHFFLYLYCTATQRSAASSLLHILLAVAAGAL